MKKNTISNKLVSSKSTARNCLYYTVIIMLGKNKSLDYKEFVMFLKILTLILLLELKGFNQCCLMLDDRIIPIYVLL